MKGDTNMRNKKRSILGLGIAATALAALALAGTGAFADSPRVPTTQPEAGATTVSTPQVADSLSEATIRSLKENGTEFTAGRIPEAPVTADQAIKVAQGSFGSTKGRSPSEMAYGTLTVEHYGRETQPDPTKPSKIDPIIADRPVWFVVFRGVDMFLSGPHVSEEYDAQRQTTYKGNLWIAIDAKTGEALGGESVDY